MDAPSPQGSDAPFRPGIGRLLRASLNAGALAGLWVGTLDAVRVALALNALPEQAILPATPLGPLQLLPNFAATVLLYGALGIPVSLAVSWVLARTFPGPGPLTFERRLFSWVTGVLGGLLAVWWVREVQASGLPVTDPRRLGPMLGAFAGAFVLAFLAGRVLYSQRKLMAISSLTVLLAWLTGFATLVRSAQTANAEGGLNDRNRDLPNVVFVIVDALRADMLEAYGNATVQTPVLEKLAQNGVVFEDAWVQAPFTGASFGSFFTGKYPRRHGLLTMEPGMRVAPGKTFIHLLEEGERSDGRSMLDADYSTASFMTGAMSHGSGLMDGFDAYQEIMLGRDLTQVSSGWSIFKGYLAPVAVAFKLRTRSNPDALVDDAAAWIRRHKGRRFAMFVHLYSTHTPYDPAPEYRKLYSDPAYDGPIQSFSAAHRIAIEQGDYAITPEDVRQIADLYMGGVSEADHHIGVLRQALLDINALNNTVFVVTSDHGEDLGEGSGLTVEDNTVTRIGRWEHNHMYRSNLWVPLIVHSPGRMPKGTRVKAPVEGVDWLPTLAELCGLALPGLVSEDPRDEAYVDGVSLVDAANTAALAEATAESGDVKPFRIAEDATFVTISDGRFMLTVERWGVLEEGWQLVLQGLPGGGGEPIGQVRFHDLQEHPSGEVDLFGDILRNPQADAELRARILRDVERLRAMLMAWNLDQPRAVESIERSDRDLETDANEAKRLADLGYTEGFNAYQGELREAVLALRAREQAGE